MNLSGNPIIKYLPSGVRRIISFVEEEYKDFEHILYIDKLNTNCVNRGDIQCEAIILTDDHFIKISCSLALLLIEKIELDKIYKVVKNFNILDIDDIENTEIKYESITLFIANNENIKISYPEFKNSSNLKAFEELISRF